MYQKKLDWEQSKKYILLYHHDEHRLNGELIDLIQIRDCGTILELLGDTPTNKETYDVLAKRTYKRSGLSETILPLESFPQWFTWFREEEIYKDYKVEIQVDDEDVITLISSIEV